MNSEDIKKENNFGFLRLFFAVLVVISHSPEMIDGNRSREILTSIFGTMSFGEVAVDGFFLISGYLITKSFEKRQSTVVYFVKRILRIVPGYLVCFWTCVLLIAPFVGGKLELWTIKYQFLQTLFMLAPDVPGVFHGQPYPVLNGSLWTIAYEFKCYLLTAILGLIGAYQYKHRLLLVPCVAALLILSAMHILDGHSLVGNHFIGNPASFLRFFGIYGVGMTFYLFRDRVKLTNKGAAMAAVILISLFFSQHLAEAAFAICGGYLIFWFAFNVRAPLLSRIGSRTDISYGLYLYAWPIQSLVIWTLGNVGPWFLCGITGVLAGALAYASWIFVEGPFLRLANRNVSVKSLLPS
ncbi:acyltransferase family protein [Undibacterium sp.]|uniref:acyltransferase family protein n=1 Tax=Undibacterium sp. TaxID=1914977 RepID=UPI00374CE5BD